MKHIDASGQDFDCPVRFNSTVTFGSGGATAPINSYTLVMYIDTIVSATTRRSYVSVPPGGDGTITHLSLTPSANVATGALEVQVGSSDNAEVHIFSIAAGTTTGVPSEQAIASGGDVAEGDVIQFTVGGANTAAGNATLAITIQRTAS